MTITPITKLRFAKLKCPACHYSLAGLTEPKCPECGKDFDAADLVRRRKSRWRRFIISALVMLLVLYAPYAWLITIDYPWSEHRWSWIKMWLGLPVVLPLHMLLNRTLHLQLDQTLGRIIVISLSLLLWLTLSYFGRRARWALLIIGLLALLYSIYSSLALYAAYRM